jgi:hypothetical protein
MQKKNIIITAILVVVVGAGAFFGGTVYEKSSLTKAGLLRGGNNLGNRQGQGEQGQNQGRPGGAGFNRGAGGGDFATGQIISKDDKSITIKIQDGGSRIVFFSDSTTVGKSTQGTAADLNTGEQVMVNGKSNPDGTVTAQNIQIRPAQGN